MGTKDPTAPPADKGKPEPLAEITAETIYQAYPRKVGKQLALCAIKRALMHMGAEALLKCTQEYAVLVVGKERTFIPHPATWFNQERWNELEDERLLRDERTNPTRPSSRQGHQGASRTDGVRSQEARREYAEPTEPPPII